MSSQPPKRLVVNADDFGFTRDVNAGIVEAHGRGILRAATLMANGAAFDDAVKLAREHPSLDVGCHLVLVQGRSLATGAPLPASLPDLLRAIARRRIRIYDELASQVQRILDAGLRPTHLDTHKHTHMLPPVLEAVAQLSEEFGIPWVRRPLDLPVLGGYLGRILARHGCRTTDHFAGYQLTGRFHIPELVALIRRLPPGATEFMCHPGRCTDELRAARTRLKESREAELEALVAPETRAACQEAGVEIVSYREL